MKFTINEYTDYINRDLAEGVAKMDRLTVAGGIKFLFESGIIKKTGETKSAEGGRGKPSDVYEFPESHEIVFWENPEDNTVENQPENVETDAVVVA